MREKKARKQVFVARIGYYLCGFAVACWAPLIAIIVENLKISVAETSYMVMCFGVSSVVGMLVAGFLISKIGFKLTYAISCLTTVLSLSTVALMPSYTIILIGVSLFSISVCCLEVAINIYAAYLERKFRVMLMSVLFAYYSMGEVIGALLMMVLLSLTIPPSIAIIVLLSIIYLASTYFIPSIQNIETASKHESKTFSRPRQPVINLALITAFTYMVGGGVMDWSGLFLTQNSDLPVSMASYGYFIVALCMLISRLYAKRILKLLGPFNATFYGALLMIAGLVLLVSIPNFVTFTLSFLMIGLGMSQISPIATSAAGHQDKMPLLSAVSLISIMGYTGLLLGPALLGSIAVWVGYGGIFIALAIITGISSSLIYWCKEDINKIAKAKSKDIDISKIKLDD